MSELHDLTALEQAAAIQSRETSAQELTEHYLNRAERLNDQVGAFVYLDRESAFQAAKEADAQVAAGEVLAEDAPLFGVVCPIKDLTMVAGMPIRFGSKAFKLDATVDENVVTAVRAGGMVITGKTNTPEFGLPCYTEPEVAPAAKSPWGNHRSAGGSSGGAAAAVSTGLAPIAHGSDGGGSIRIPSAVTGLVGLKPSRGRVSNGPIGDGLGDLVVNGPLARTVADAAALLDVMSMRFAGDPYGAHLPKQGTFLDAAKREPGSLKIGFYRRGALIDVPIHEEVERALTNTLEALENLGHDIVEVEPPFGEGLLPIFEVMWTILAAGIPVPPELESELRPLTQYLRGRGKEVAGPDLAAALGTIRTQARISVAAVDDLDVVVAPTIADLPAEVGQLRNDDDPAKDFMDQVKYSPFCSAYNTTGQPAINVPMNWTEGDLPVGIQLVGRMFDEETIISLASQLEQSNPWAQRKPELW
ncbi:MAG: amidase [Candidatus Nanopelagicales bacterium]